MSRVLARGRAVAPALAARAMHGLAMRDTHALARGCARALAVMLMLAWAAALVVGLAPVGAHAQQPLRVPSLAGRVNDLTGTLSADERRTLEQQLAAIEQRKGAQVVVLIVPSTQPEPIEAYSIRVAEQWKIGRGKVDGRAVDDGVIVVVAKNDRRVRIEVGYGLEGAIPDALAKRIIDETISPHFRQGDFYGGLQAAIADIAKLIDGESLPPPWQPGHGAAADHDGGSDWLAIALFVIVGGMIATRILGRLLGSAAAGTGAGVLAGSALGIVAGVGIGIVVFAFLLVFSAMGGGIARRGRHTWGSGPVIFPGGWGGGAGGWGGGGGGGGGGFSGGGGGFGGGGASGGW